MLMNTRRQAKFDEHRQNLEEINMEAANVELQQQLRLREQQLEQLTNAVHQLQAREAARLDRERVLREVAHMSTYTGKGEVTINSFLKNVEYYLKDFTSEETKKFIIRTIYNEKIQGEAKEIIINIPDPENWETIKKQLKLRYRPDVEPADIYRNIHNIKISTVSELLLEVQRIKFKSDELINFYKGDNAIDLSNVDSLLVNMLKEICQGTLLEKIYEEKEIDTIFEIMLKRRYEDTCIREEYRRTKYKSGNNNQQGNVGHSRNIIRYSGQNRQEQNTNNYPRNFTTHSGQNRYEQNVNNNYRNFATYSGQNRQEQIMSNNYNNNPRNNNNYRNPAQYNNRYSGQYQQFSNNSGRNRNSEQFRQQQNPEPMDIGNIERNNCENNAEFFCN